MKSQSRGRNATVGLFADREHNDREPLECARSYRVTRTKGSHMTATRTTDPEMCDSTHVRLAQ